PAIRKAGHPPCLSSRLPASNPLGLRNLLLVAAELPAEAGHAWLCGRYILSSAGAFPSTSGAMEHSAQQILPAAGREMAPEPPPTMPCSSCRCRQDSGLA